VKVAVEVVVFVVAHQSPFENVSAGRRSFVVRAL
jgi:hypothetical protein